MKTYDIVFRMGGTHSCEWRQVLGHYAESECRAKRRDIERMGYRTIAGPSGWVKRHGMPIGWNAPDPFAFTPPAAR